MNSLKKYNEKRDFKLTPEPRGRFEKRKGRYRYFIQKHDASHLHFDFRLEYNGVLKSWAVPKGPSVSPKVRRLAMEVEDHPLDYGTFEGTIPKGEYGGGTVMLWDKGTWTPEENPAIGFKNGKITFNLKGKRLNGEWTLVRSSRTQGHKNMWFLIKHQGSHESQPSQEPVETNLSSVSTGRSMEEIASKKKKQTVAVETKIHPELATLVEKIPEGDQWIHEIKFDGYRITAVIGDHDVHLYSRNGLDWTTRFQSIAEHLKKLKIKNAVLDGEIIVPGPQGHSDFQALQEALKKNLQSKLVYYVFDLTSFNGKDLRQTPLIKRKDILKKILSAKKSKTNSIKFSDYTLGHGEKLFGRACKLGLEGIVSKRKDSAYIEKRSSDWLKVKCIYRQEFVVVGYSAPQGARSGFGALLLALPDGKGKFRYVGRSGTGFNQTLINDIKKKLDKIKVKNIASLYDPSGELDRQIGVTWVKPKIVVEEKFASWTRDKHLRQAVFLGVREDKAPSDLTFEKPKSLESVQKRAPISNNLSDLKISKPEKVLFSPDVTKRDLASYFIGASKWLLPYFKDRPLAIVRCPDGNKKSCFFQKHVAPTKLVKNGRSEEFIWIDSLPGIISLVQLGVLEFHGWEARADKPEKPDQIVFDLDQDVKVDWGVMRKTALRLRDRLKLIKLQSFLKTTGGKGLHIIVPFKPERGWDEVKSFSKIIAETMENEFPDLYTANMAKAKRANKIFIDYLRNGRGATAVLPYSTRAKDRAPISVPIEWDELSKIKSADQFNIRNIFDRLNSLEKDPWRDFFKVQKKQRLPNLGSL